MAEREACLVVPAAYWFAIHGGSPDPDLEHLEYKLRCRIIVEGSAILLASILEFADSSSQFRKLTAERLEKIPKHRILREESWVQGT